MFNVGGMELVVVVLAVVVLGPDRLPSALRQAGTLLGRLRQLSQGLQTDVRSAIVAAEAEAETTDARSAAPDRATTGFEAN